MRINWKVFDGNSNTEEAVADFGSGEIKTYKDWISACWPWEAKEEIRRIAYHTGINILQVRKRARRRAHKYFDNPYS